MTRCTCAMASPTTLAASWIDIAASEAGWLAWLAGVLTRVLLWLVTAQRILGVEATIPRHGARPSKLRFGPDVWFDWGR